MTSFHPASVTLSSDGYAFM